jgi:hypothetical protein
MNYQNGKIYRIVCNITGQQYVGSTCQKLSQRMAQHRSKAKDGKKYYCKSKPIIDRGNYDIVLIEDCPSETKEQLARRERHYIDEMECVNKHLPTRTIQEYREEHKEHLSIRAKEYYQKNRDKIIAQSRLRDKVAESNYKKEYYQKNRERILAKQKERDQQKSV